MAHHTCTHPKPVSGAPYRRYWSPEDKAKIVEDTLRPGVSVAAVAREHGIGPNMIYRWRMEHRHKQPVKAKDRRQSPEPTQDTQAPDALSSRMLDLERLVVELTLENRKLHEALGW